MKKTTARKLKAMQMMAPLLAMGVAIWTVFLRMVGAPWVLVPLYLAAVALAIWLLASVLSWFFKGMFMWYEKDE